VQEPLAGHQDAAFRALLHHNPDIAIRQALVGAVQAVEHRGPRRPVQRSALGEITEECAMHRLHPPGPLTDRAEHHQLLQLGEQGCALVGVGASLPPHQCLAAVAQGRGLPLHRLQQGRRQAATGGFDPDDVVLGREGLEARLQLLQQFPLGTARPLPQRLGQGGDRSVIAIRGAQFHGGFPQERAAFWPAELLEDRSGAHWRQLVGVPDQQQLRVRRQRL